MKRIVLVHSFEENKHSNDLFSHELIKEFEKNKIHPELHTFYLDCDRYLDKKERQIMYNYLDSIALLHPDIILVNDDQATYSLLACGHPLVKEVPVVFAGVNYPNWSLLKNYPNVTGFHDKQDFEKNVEFIHALFGQICVRVAYDQTVLGKKAFVDVLEQLRPNKRVEFLKPFKKRGYTRYIKDDGDIQQLMDSTENDMDVHLPFGPDALVKIEFSPFRVVFAPILLDALSSTARPITYLDTKYDYVSEAMPKLVTYPSFSAHNEPVKYQPGIPDKYLGGYFTPIETQAREQAQMASAILNGMPVAQLPVRESAKEYVVIWEIAKTAGLSINNLPAYTRIIGMPFGERHKNVLVIVYVFAFLVVAVIIFFLTLMYIREARYKRLAQEDLMQKNLSLEVALEKSLESERMKSAFLANMSHEIRTPLNAIVGFSNILNSDMVLEPAERQNFMELINSNCDLLLSLINDILDLSRIESGRMAFTFEDYDLNDLMLEIYKVYKIMMPPNVALQIEIPENHVMLHTDKHRLTQVVTNFLNNAVKFTLQGHIKIGYSHQPEKESVCIFVEDTGKGIAKEKLELIFGRFTKLDEFAQGTGLGLSICKVIVERFGGEIRVDSEEGKGSRFMVDLPC